MEQLVSTYDNNLVCDNVDKRPEETVDCNTFPVLENSSKNDVVESPEELLHLGRNLLLNKNISSAVEIFSQAIQAKLEILGHDCSLDASLAIFYLEYGDALLKHLEDTCDIFKENAKALDHLVSGNEKSSSSSNNMLEPDDNVSDEQLAWEMLELSRICYDKSLKNILNDDKTLPLPIEGSLSLLLQDPLPYPIETATKASYVHLRLGDMLFSQSLFGESLTEYKQSLHILFIYNIPYPYWLMPTIAIATCEHCVKNYFSAIYFYERALEIVTETLKHKEKQILLREKEKLDHMKEDLEIQLNELKTCLNSGQIMPQIAPAQYQNSFSAPQLDSKAHPVINLGIVTRKKSAAVIPANNDAIVESQYKKQKI